MTKIYRTLPQEARKRGMWGSFLVFKKIPKVRKKYIYFQIKSCGGGLCKCANERHRNDFIKYDAMMIRKQSPDTLRFLFGSLAC